MSFRIHTKSPELGRDLASKLAELEGQLDESFEYEISAENLPREHAFARARELAQSISAESVFAAEGTLAPEPAQQPELLQDEDPDFAMGLPPVSDEPRAAEDNVARQEVRSSRLNTQKMRDTAAAKSNEAREILQSAGEQTGAALKAAGKRMGQLIRHASAWAVQSSSEAKTHGIALRSRLTAKSAQWKTAFDERSAARQERRRKETEVRQERQRAAHREAELAAISAQFILEQHKQEQKARQVAEEGQHKPASAPTIKTISQKPEKEYRDTWPVWRGAFAGAACMALIAVFLLAGTGKQSSASPATSTELAKPSVVVPSHTVIQPSVPAVVPRSISRVVEKPIAKPAARKHIESSTDGEESFQEVTVRHYPSASPAAPPKKDAKGVVQITDME